MRMKMVCDDRTLREISNEFLALKKAQKIRDRTLSDYRKYIDTVICQKRPTAYTVGRFLIYFSHSAGIPWD